MGFRLSTEQEMNMGVKVVSSSGTKIALAQYIASKNPPRVPRGGTQVLRVLKALLAGQHLTRGKAASELHVRGLPQKVDYLRQLGWPIKTIRIKASNDFGQMTWQGQYSIAPQKQ